MKHRSRIALLSAVASLAIAIEASAEPSSADRALSRSLFDDGRRLVRDGHVADACPKFEDAQRLDPGIGTLFNLADCYERVGRLASAWAAFLETADAARTAAETNREVVARHRADALVQRLPRVVVVTDANADVAGLEVRWDGKPLGRASWGAPLPVDAGTHKLEATAPGRMPWSFSTSIGADPATTRLPIPPLDAELPNNSPKAVSVQSPPPEAPTPSRWQKPAALAGAGLGVVAVSVGTVFALKASSSWADAQPHCPGNVCSPAGRQQWSDARSSGNVATAAFIVGGVALVTGTLLWLAAPSLHVGASGSASQATLKVQGAF